MKWPFANFYNLLATPDIKNTSAEPSADDFLARERAILGDDANLFATAQDSTAFDGDILGDGDETSKFKSQFPEVIPQACPIPAPRLSVTACQNPLRTNGSCLTPERSLGDVQLGLRSLR